MKEKEVIVHVNGKYVTLKNFSSTKGMRHYYVVFGLFMVMFVFYFFMGE